MTSKPLITATNLSLTRQGTALLSDISCTIETAQTIVIMGHNGAGKTLLLNLLHGLITADSGMIDTAADISQKMVFQKPILLRRTAKAHFAFTSGITSLAETKKWFAYAGIAEKLSQQARHLSAGEAQKLAFISALATKPDILFLDEPTANLDADSRGDIEALITHAKQSGTTIVMVTHALAQAKRLADKFLFLHKGQIYDNVSADAFLSGTRSAEASAFLSELSGS